MLTSRLVALLALAALLAAASSQRTCDDAPVPIMTECQRLVGATDLQPAVQFANHVVATYDRCVDSFLCAGYTSFLGGDMLTAITAFERVGEGQSPVGGGRVPSACVARRRQS